jgi:hypothetical protein
MVWGRARRPLGIAAADLADEAVDVHDPRARCRWQHDYIRAKARSRALVAA